MYNELSRILSESSDSDFESLLATVGDEALKNALKSARSDRFESVDLDVQVNDADILRGAESWLEDAAAGGDAPVPHLDEDAFGAFASSFLERLGKKDSRMFFDDVYQAFDYEEVVGKKRDAVLSALSRTGGRSYAFRAAAAKAMLAIDASLLPAIVVTTALPALLDAGSVTVDQLADTLEKHPNIRLNGGVELFDALKLDIKWNGFDRKRRKLHGLVVERMKEVDGKACEDYVAFAAAGAASLIRWGDGCYEPSL